MRGLASLFLIYFWVYANAQSNSDSLVIAKELAYNKKFEESINILKNQSDPNSQQFLSRVYAWSKQYKSSLEISNQLISRNPEVVSNYQIAATTALWGSMWSASYEYAKSGIEKGGNELDLSKIQIQVLISQEKYFEAEALCKAMLINYPENPDLLSLYEIAQNGNLKKELYLTQIQDYFTLDNSSWKTTTIGFKNQTNRGPLLIQMNRSSRFMQNGVQGQIEWYPKLDSNHYAYVETGFSPSILFPQYRIGASIFRNLNSGFELELGARNLKFKDVGNVWFYISSIRKYFGNNSLYYGLTYVIGPDGTSATHSLRLSHYFNDGISRISVAVGSGTNARDFQSYENYQPFTQQDAHLFQTEYKQRLTLKTSIAIGFTFEKAQYRDDQTGERLTYGIHLNRRF